ncbi:AAA family ATPase [Shewanella bicestrii]
MRMPNIRQLSEEQLDIFEDAPIDGSILVSGPPGTGKTVIAFLRAQRLAKRNIDITVLMFNRILRKYTENIASDISGNVQSKTMHSWLPRWWLQHRIDNNESEKVYVNCPFEKKDALKAIGGKWDKHKRNPFTNGKGMWFIPQELYHSNPEAYSAWERASFDPPEIQQWQYNWMKMLDLYLNQPPESMHDWGHLILDEAQDFEPELFTFLNLVSKQLDNGGLTVLADENQRLEENRNSSLDEIRANLKITKKPEREFRLTVNFRNTCQIAKVASYFYVGLATGMPNPPSRQGSKPVMVFTTDTDAQIEYICRSLRNRSAVEVGVIVDNDADRELFTREIARRLPSYHVQTYSSREYRQSESLQFDRQGVVTVIHRKSCKGLEFDSVFIPQLQSFSVDDRDQTTFKMNLYVMCSRARNELVFLCNGDTDTNHAFFEHFPSRVSDLVEYREQI